MRESYKNILRHSLFLKYMLIMNIIKMFSKPYGSNPDCYKEFYVYMSLMYLMFK